MNTQITHEELKSLLKQGPVDFSFRKKDGSLREAKGTLELSNVPIESQPKGGKGPTGVIFFDLDKNGWRCVSLESEIYVQ